MDMYWTAPDPDTIPQEVLQGLIKWHHCNQDQVKNMTNRIYELEISIRQKDNSIEELLRNQERVIQEKDNLVTKLLSEQERMIAEKVAPLQQQVADLSKENDRLQKEILELKSESSQRAADVEGELEGELGESKEKEVGPTESQEVKNSNMDHGAAEGSQPARISIHPCTGQVTCFPFEGNGQCNIPARRVVSNQEPKTQDLSAFLNSVPDEPDAAAATMPKEEPPAPVPTDLAADAASDARTEPLDASGGDTPSFVSNGDENWTLPKNRLADLDDEILESTNENDNPPLVSTYNARDGVSGLCTHFLYQCPCCGKSSYQLANSSSNSILCLGCHNQEGDNGADGTQQSDNGADRTQQGRWDPSQAVRLLELVQEARGYREPGSLRFFQGTKECFKHCVRLANVPNNMTRKEVKAFLDNVAGGYFRDKYDFLYLAFDWTKGKNLGYVFVNFIGKQWSGDSHQQTYAEEFREKCEGYKLSPSPKSKKICLVEPATCQGLEAMKDQYAPGNHDVYQHHKRFWPIVFSKPLTYDTQSKRWITGPGPTKWMLLNGSTDLGDEKNRNPGPAPTPAQRGRQPQRRH